MQNSVAVLKFRLPNILAWMLAVFFALTPLDYILPHVGNATVLRYAGAVIVFSCAVYLLFNSRLRFSLSQNQLIIFFMIVMCAISCIWADYFSVAVSFTTSFGFTAIMYFILFLFDYSEKQIDLIEIGSIIGGIILIWYVFTKANLANVFAGYRLDFDNIGGSYFSDPNGLSARIMMPLVFSIKRLINSKRWINKAICAAITIALIFIIFLTGSRGAIVAAVLIFFCMAINSIQQKKIGILLVLGLMGVIILFYLPDMLPEHISSRIFNISKYEAVFNTTGDRIDIWINAITKVFPGSPLWGYGAGNSPYAMIQVYGKLKAIHNGFLLCLIDTGLIGFIPWIILLMNNFITAVKLRKKDIFVLAVLIAVVVMSSMLDSMMEKYLWNAYLYVYMKDNVFRLKNEEIGV